VPHAISAEGTAQGSGQGLATKVRRDLGFRDLGVVDGQLGTLFQEVLADPNRRRFTGVVGVRFEGKTKDSDALTGHGSEQLLHHQLSDAVLLPAVELHHALPIGSNVVEAVVTAEVHQVEDVLLEAAAAKTRASFEELGADAAIGADGMGYLIDVSAGGLAERGNRVDRADALRQERVGGEFGEL